MTQADIDAGRLICIIGIAPARPAEFVIFRIPQTPLGSAWSPGTRQPGRTELKSSLRP